MKHDFIKAAFGLASIALATSLSCAAAKQAAQVAPPVEKTALAERIGDAIADMPQYFGEHRAFLKVGEADRLERTAELIQAGIDLEEFSEDFRLFWMWKRQECFTLIGEDLKNRTPGRALVERLSPPVVAELDHGLGSDYFFQKALDEATRALELNGSDFYCELNHDYTHYVRGMAFHNLGRFSSALAEYELAIEVADVATVAAREDQSLHVSDAPAIKAKAEAWLIDTHMRLLDEESAIAAAELYYLNYADGSLSYEGAHLWDLAHGAGGVLGNADIYLYSRQFEKARRSYLEVLQIEQNFLFSRTYQQLGYLTGLLENPATRTESDDRASGLLLDAVNRENGAQAKLYQVLWMWLLGEHPDHTDVAESQLVYWLRRRGIESYWDRTLIAFMVWQNDLFGPNKSKLWDKIPDNFLANEPSEEKRRKEWAAIDKLSTGDSAEFITLAEQEVVRRIRHGELVDDLMSEAWFYVGVRAEKNAESAKDPEQIAALKESALQAYFASSSYPLNNFKWEPEYARLNANVLGRELNYKPALGFQFSELQITAVDPDSLAKSRGLVPGEIVALKIHSPLARASRDGLREFRSQSYTPQIGDLLQMILRVNGADYRVDTVVGAKSE